MSIPQPTKQHREPIAALFGAGYLIKSTKAGNH
jgi:hypothetical protein